LTRIKITRATLAHIFTSKVEIYDKIEENYDKAK